MASFRFRSAIRSFALIGSCSIVALCASVSSTAHAAGPGGGDGASVREKDRDRDRDRARDAYDRGVRAHALGEHLAAARAFAEADAFAPTPASLEGALESAMRADDAVLGLELLDRADARSDAKSSDANLLKTVGAAKKRFWGRAGRIRIDCKGASRCLATVDGVDVDVLRPTYVRIGSHAVVLQRDGERFDRLVEVAPDATVVVTSDGASSNGPPAPAAPSTGAVSNGTQPDARPGGEAPPPRGTGISPVWFYVGVGATTLAGVLTIVSGLDAVSLHDQFEDVGCPAGTSGARVTNCDARRKDGESAQLRTNILLGATGVLAVATTTIGLFAVRWKSGAEARLSFGATSTSASAGLRIVMP